MKYEQCQKHTQEYLQLVCMLCSEQSLACPVCIDKQHLKHPIISLKKFILQEIPKLYQTGANTAVVNETINNLQMFIAKTIDGMRKEIAAEIKTLEETYNNYFEGLKMEIGQILEGEDNCYTNTHISQIKRKIERGYTISTSKNIENQSKIIRGKIQLNIKEATIDVCKIIKNLLGLWDNCKQIFLNEKKNSNYFNFSKSNKHKSVQIQGLSVQNTIYDSSYHLCLVQPHLQNTHNEVSFKIENTLHKCIWIGVCDLKIVKNKKFINCFQKGQGAYMLWQSGLDGGAQFFSHLNKDSQSINWNFDVGDIVAIKVKETTEKSTVVFCKQKMQFSAQLQKGKTYFACVAMGDQREKLSLVN